MRLVSAVISSNGSTSQASICASTLALMDAGMLSLKVAIKGNAGRRDQAFVMRSVSNWQLITPTITKPQ